MKACDSLWKSRGYLPHFDQPGLVQHIVFRLADSLPRSVYEKILQVTEGDSEENFKKRRRVNIMLDKGYGSCVLRDPVNAQIIESSMLYFDSERYNLLAWVIMPNHVHALIETREGWPLAGIVKSWKSFSSRRINDRKKVERAGLEAGAPDKRSPLWQREYFDRYMRDEQHFHTTLRYIEQNPVYAGLVTTPEHWLFSSASHRS